MSECREWVYRGASATAWACGGMAVIRPAGVICDQSAGLILSDCAATMTEWAADGLVAEYTGAQLAIDADSLLRSAMRARGGLELPTALIVKRDDLPMWQSYAGLMARNGVLRGVFTDYDAGLAWARRQSAVFAADRRRRTPAA